MTYRPPTQTTIADVTRACNRTADVIADYLRDQGVQQTVDGFFATALTGDEDDETIRRYQQIYGPLRNLLHALIETPQRSAIRDEETESSPTWHSAQYDVLACTGEEPDAKIASIYRQSIGG